MATKNDGKLGELRVIFAAFGWTIALYGAYVDPEEGDRSYAENAALKAEALRAQLAAAGATAAVLGDDSGLEVDALDRRPGIRSARYGPPGASWSERRTLLLDELRRTDDPSRSARFVCALHFIASDGTAIAAEATCEGTIATAESGDGGFSYDPIFRPVGSTLTFANIPAEVKNATSHRARAARALVARLTATTGTRTFH